MKGLFTIGTYLILCKMTIKKKKEEKEKKNVL